MEIDEAVRHEAVETCYPESFVGEVTLTFVSCESMFERRYPLIARAVKVYNNKEENDRVAALCSQNGCRQRTKVSFSRTDRADQC